MKLAKQRRSHDFPTMFMYCFRSFVVLGWEIAQSSPDNISAVCSEASKHSGILLVHLMSAGFKVKREDSRVGPSRQIAFSTRVTIFQHRSALDSVFFRRRRMNTSRLTSESSRTSLQSKAVIW